MRTVLLSCLTLLSPITAAAQSDPAMDPIVFEGKTWRGGAQNARVEPHLGRNALTFGRGQLWLEDANFSDGVIEFDVAYEEAQTFIGMMWRAERDDRYEDIYVRAHLNGKPDAFQYTPTENGLAAWQIFSDGNAQTAVDEKFGAWNHVKLVAVGDAADVYFNSEKPVLHIPDLKTDIAAGGIGLWALSLDGKEVHISNFSIRALRSGETLAGTAVKTTPPPTGLIESWKVSSPFSEAAIQNALLLDDGALDGLSWADLDVETNGIANIARIAAPLPDRDSTVFIRMKINSQHRQLKELRFGYSDRVRIYLNGKRVYYGNAGWKVRDYRFLGTVGFFDSAGLDLKKGDNELLVAVSETFGGWAWAGAIEDQSGITLQD